MALSNDIRCFIGNEEGGMEIGYDSITIKIYFAAAHPHAHPVVVDPMEEEDVFVTRLTSQSAAGADGAPSVAGGSFPSPLATSFFFVSPMGDKKKEVAKAEGEEPPATPATPGASLAPAADPEPSRTITTSEANTGGAKTAEMGEATSS
ncbi:hypothetical protein Tco_0777221 [Tanacetum coccineum]